MGKNLSSMFQSKDKKWSKKGEGHTLAAAAASSSSTPRPVTPSAPEVPRAPPSVPSRANPAAAAAAARAAGGATKPSTTARAAGGQSRPASAAGSRASGALSAQPMVSQQEYAQALQMLQEMGFEPGQAARALETSAGDLDAAVEALSSGVVAASPSLGSATPVPPAPGSSSSAASSSSVRATLPPPWSETAMEQALSRLLDESPDPVAALQVAPEPQPQTLLCGEPRGELIAGLYVFPCLRPHT